MPSTNDSHEEVDSINHHWHHHKKPGMILVAIVVAVLLFGAGTLVGLAGNRFTAVRFSSFGPGPKMAGVVSGQFGGPGFRVAAPYSSLNQIEGVVTAVNGSTLTIAGDGATNNITTNSSTQYTGGSQPKVNDTVIVSGSISNNTFTASQITINP